MGLLCRYRALGLVVDGHNNPELVLSDAHLNQEQNEETTDRKAIVPSASTGWASSISSIQGRGADSFFCTAVDRGRSIHMYNARTLRLVGSTSLAEEQERDGRITRKSCSMGPAADLHVHAMALSSDSVFVATSSKILLLQRMHTVAEWSLAPKPVPIKRQSTASFTSNPHPFCVHGLIIFGDVLVALMSTSALSSHVKAAIQPRYRLVSWDVSKAALGELLVGSHFNPPMVSDIWLDERTRDDTSLDPYPLSPFIPKHLIHPDTYINKVLIAGCEGRMQLWNIQTSKLVFEFSSLKIPRDFIHSFHSTMADPLQISALCSSPVLDVVAVGLACGIVVLYNIRFDKVVDVFRHELNIDSRKPIESLEVTSLSFRSDGDESLVSCTRGGELAVWDLNERQLRVSIPSVHAGDRGVTFGSFLHGEALFLTCGASDNSLKLVAFDQPDGYGRVLLYRAGHSAPPMFIRYCGDDHRQLVSAGRDRHLRIISTIMDTQNRSMSQKNARVLGGKKAQQKRRRLNQALHGDGHFGAITFSMDDVDSESARALPEITDLCTADVKRSDADFANIITCHTGSKELYTWRLEDGASTKKVLHPPLDSLPAKIHGKLVDHGRKKPQNRNALTQAEVEKDVGTAVAMTSDGHLAFSATAQGRIFCFSLQSGRFLGEFFRTTTLVQETSKRFHGPYSDQVEVRLSAHDGLVRALAVDALGEVLISGDEKSGVLRLWSIKTFKLGQEVVLKDKPGVARIVWCHLNNLISVACDDFSIQVFDGSTGALARVFGGHTGRITDLAFSHDGRMLLSTGMDSTLRHWSLPDGCCFDIETFEEAPTSVAVSPNGEYIATTHIDSLGIMVWVNKRFFNPLVSGSVQKRPNLKLPQAKADVNDDGVITLSSSGLVTLSKVPRSQWTVLADLQLIKERNKPKEPVQKADEAPFFLPTIRDLKPGLQVEAVMVDAAKKHVNQSKTNRESRTRSESELVQLSQTKQYDQLASLLCSWGPSRVDSEIRMLQSAEQLGACLSYFADRLQTKSDFELVEAHLSLLLRVHSVELMQDAECRDKLLPLIRQLHGSAWDEVQGMLETSIALTSHMLGAE